MLLSFPYYLQLVEKKFAIFISHKENCKWKSLASLFILNMTILIIFLVHSIVYLFHLFLWIKNAITTHRCMNERVINKLIFWTFFSLILWNVNYNYLWCFWRYCMQRHWLVQYDFWQEIFSWGKKCKTISFHSSFHYYIFTF